MSTQSRQDRSRSREMRADEFCSILGGGDGGDSKKEEGVGEWGKGVTLIFQMDTHPAARLCL